MRSAIAMSSRAERRDRAARRRARPAARRRVRAPIWNKRCASASDPDRVHPDVELRLQIEQVPVRVAERQHLRAFGEHLDLVRRAQHHGDVPAQQRRPRVRLVGHRTRRRQHGFPTATDGPLPHVDDVEEAGRRDRRETACAGRRRGGRSSSRLSAPASTGRRASSPADRAPRGSRLRRRESGRRTKSGGSRSSRARRRGAPRSPTRCGRHASRRRPSDTACLRRTRRRSGPRWRRGTARRAR